MFNRFYNKNSIRKLSNFEYNNIEKIIQTNIKGNFFIWEKDNILITDTIITQKNKQNIKKKLSSYTNIQYFIKTNTDVFEYCISNNLNRQNFIDILNHPLISSKTKYYTKK